MNDGILSHEPVIRLSASIGIFALVALWELRAQRRGLRSTRGERWFGNLGIVVLNTVVLRLLFPTAAVGMALFAKEQGWGLLNHVELPAGLAIGMSVVLLDFAIYLQHVIFHAVRPLWRLHMVHHADADFDVTTGLRFHPLEMILSMLIKLAVVAVLGAPARAVLIFEVLLNATAMFSHGNARMPLRLDRVLRCFVVTPDMHRVHHSVKSVEHNSNFGFNLPWWDRLLGTYRSQPAGGHEGMTIGLEQFQEPRRQSLGWMLALPFAGSSGVTRGCA